MNRSIRRSEYTPDRIRSLLKHQQTDYKVIPNDKLNLSSTCWKVFGYPAKKCQENDQFEKIDGFTSCQLCYQTFTYTAKSGTRNMNDHLCVKNLPNSETTQSTIPPGQKKLDNMLKNYKRVKLSQSELNTVKNLTCSWLCEDMRPFTIVEDNGLRGLLQEFINLGKFISRRIFPPLRCIAISGAKYGEFDVTSGLRGADVLSDHAYQLADSCRSKIRAMLKEPYEAGAVCVSPDLWSDSYKQISYLGLTASFVDDQHFYKTVELCCKPYTEIDHSAANLLSVSIEFDLTIVIDLTIFLSKAIRKVLEQYDLCDLSRISFMSDRGANLVKALREYDTLFCFLHRVNNILKRAFFQSKNKQNRSNKSKTTQPSTSSSTITDKDNYLSDSSSEEEELFTPTIQIKQKNQRRKINRKQLKIQ